MRPHAVTSGSAFRQGSSGPRSPAWSPVNSELRLFTLNIGGPSLSRAEALVAYLCWLDPDVLVLTETRDTPGTHHLLRAFGKAGYQVLGAARMDGAERGVAIVHRLRGLDRWPTVTLDLAHRLVVLPIAGRPSVTLVGTYVPSRDGSPHKIARKRTFIEQMLTCVNAIAQKSDVILMGDLNVVQRSHLPRYSVFRAWEYASFDRIATCGLVDAFAELNPGATAYTWIGRKGDGYRYDYAFVSRRLLVCVRSCEYLDDARLHGLTDHAGQLLKISLPGTRVRPTAAAYSGEALLPIG